MEITLNSVKNNYYGKDILAMLPFIGCINSQYVQENVTNGPFNVSMWGLELNNCMETGEDCFISCEHHAPVVFLILPSGSFRTKPFFLLSSQYLNIITPALKMCCVIY